jgi:hypothetical protein
MAQTPSDTTIVRTPETPGDDALVLREWRQRALSEGIAPQAIDRHILSLPEVPDSTKDLIRKQFEAAKVQEDTFPTDLPRQGEIPSRGGVNAGGAEITGGVNVLDTRAQMQQMLKDAQTPQVQEGLPVPGSGAGPEKQADVPVEVPPTNQMQTVEQKELTTSQGTLTTDAGLSRLPPLGMSGYPPSKNVAEHAAEIAEKGPVDDAKTWQAMLLQRFLALWGSMVGLFSAPSKSPVSQ